jgi:hypothetical protein
LSHPLQTDLWLLRRLRPLSRVLAFSHPFRVKRSQSSPIPHGSVLATRSCLLYAGCSVVNSLLPGSSPHRDILSSEFTADETNTIAFWLKCLNRIHFFSITTLQTEVPRVSIGRRVSPITLAGSRSSVHCQRASHLEECRSSTHAASPFHRYPNGVLMDNTSAREWAHVNFGIV